MAHGKADVRVSRGAHRDKWGGEPPNSGSSGGRARFAAPCNPWASILGRVIPPTRPTLSIPATLPRTLPAPEKADPGQGWWAGGGSLGQGERSRLAPPPGAAIGRDLAGGPAAPCALQLLSAKVPTWQLRAIRRSVRRLSGRSGWASRARTLRSLGRSLSNPTPGSHAGRALTLPLGARLRGAMDAALLHSLLEANCSLELAEELLLDGWGLPLDPEGRREASGPGRRELLPWRAGCPQGPALRAPRALRPAALRAPSNPSEPRSAVSRRQVPTPTATRPWTRSGRAGPGARPELWWRGSAPSTSTASSTTRPVSVPRTLRRGFSTRLPGGRFRG